MLIRLLLQVCVFLSGGVALVMEAVFHKYLATLVGSTTSAAAIVLAIYFLGLTGGALLAPKQVAGAGRRLAALEFFISIWSIVLALLFYPSYDLFARLLPSGPSPLPLALGRGLIALFWILPPTLAMGAHLPTLRAALEELSQPSPGLLTRLYALNLAGSFVFTLAAPFALFAQLGLQGTLLCMAAVGFGVTAALWFGLGRRSPASPAAAAGSTASEGVAPAAARPSRLPPLALGLAVGSGFAFFALEVVWNHLIAAVLGASTYSFSILLGAVLLSLALGSRWVEAAAPKGADEARRVVLKALGLVVLLLPLCSALWPHAGRVLADLGGGLSDFWAGEALKLAVACVLVLPVAIAGGTLFPLTFHFLGQQRAPDAPEVGRLYALNAAGCAAGSVVGGFVFIPALGAERTFVLLWVVALLCAAGLALVERRNGRPLSRPVTGALGAGLLLTLLLPAWDRSELTAGYGVYLMRHVPPEARLVDFEESNHTAFTTVRTMPAEDHPLGRSETVLLYSNGKFDADDDQELASQSALGFLPSLYARDQQRALVVGLGGGHTVATVRSAGFQKVDVCEISPGHISAARRWFRHLNRGVLDQPEVTIIEEDGRNHLLRTPERYDLISIEVTSVWFSGASNLYSQEFYRSVRRRLAPGGVLVQWVQLHHITPTEIATVIGTLAGEFPHLEVWNAGAQAIMLASTEPLVLHADRWPRFLANPELKVDVEVFSEMAGGSAIENVLQLRLLDAAGVREFLAKTPHAINSDRNKWLEFHTPRHLLSRQPHLQQNLEYLGRFAPDSVPPPATAGAPSAPAPADAPGEAALAH